jgi:TRAP-type C4-dicarboxylate transport system substrate-binding protein
VEDIAGLKLRVIPNAINVDWVKALGANPTPMAFPEVYAGLEQKAIDGQENPLSVILANKFFEVQKHLALTNHQYNPQSIIFSKKVWDSLSADEKKIVQDAAVEAGRFQRQVNRDAAASQLDQLKKAGMQVTEFNAAEQAKLRAKLEAGDRQAWRGHQRHRGRTAGRAGQAAQVNAVAEPAVATVAATATKLLCGLIGAGIQRSLTPAMQEAEARPRACACTTS